MTNKFLRKKPQTVKLVGDKIPAIRNTYLEIFGSYDTNVHGGKFFIHLFNEICYTYTFYTQIDLAKSLELLTKRFDLKPKNYLIKEEAGKSKNPLQKDYSATTYFIKLKEKVLLEINNYKIIFWYGKDIDFKEIEETIEILATTKKKKKHKKKFYMVSANHRAENNLEFKKFSIKKADIQLDMNYNTDFAEVNDTVMNFLNTKNQNGLVLLHGKYGTGKTSYIRHMMNHVNKRFIFLPLDMMEIISSPSFIPFIAKHNDSILVLEDCENMLIPRMAGNSSNALVNLLNLGDGLLSDALSIKLVCTFNTSLQQIDQAILRKGRLIARYEFKELEIKQAQKLSDHLEQNREITKPETLAEIYNSEKKDFSNLNKNSTVGFS